MKLLLISLLVVFSTCHAQTFVKYRVLDRLNHVGIANARIIYLDQVYYTNDDGDVNMPKEVKEFEVSAAGYQTLSFTNISTRLLLDALPKDIEEISVTGVDVKGIFQKVLKNYRTIYYSKRSLYRGTISQKGYIDGKLINLLVADISLWSRYNLFNFNAKADYDSFVQISIDDVKYYNPASSYMDYPFKTDVQLLPIDFVQKIFMNSQLSALLNEINKGGVIGKVIDGNMESEYRHIRFEVGENLINKTKISGSFIYSNRDSAILNLVFTVDQGNIVRTHKSDKGEEYTVRSSRGEIMYDFYKKSNQYILGQVKVTGGGAVTYKEKVYPMYFSQVISLNNFEPTKKKLIGKKINLNEHFVKGISFKNDNQEDRFLLSKEEKLFMDGKF